jgi:PIN domain nuclease of toxin-antitoxin system
MKGLLLDTHIWIWLMEGNPLISNKHKKIINSAAEGAGVYIAAISTWEVSMLAMKKRIVLEKPVLVWLNEALALPGIELKELSPDIAAESCELPENEKFHGDPADCLIVATARIHGLTILTHDKKMLRYAKQDYVSIIAV